MKFCSQSFFVVFSQTVPNSITDAAFASQELTLLAFPHKPVIFHTGFKKSKGMIDKNTRWLRVNLSKGLPDWNAKDEPE